MTSSTPSADRARSRLHGAPRWRSVLASVTALACSALLVLGSAPAARAASAQEVILTTTTSVRDSGLLDAVLPAFRAATGIDVKVIAVGSGAAIQMARDGNADLVLAHAPEAEEKLVADGFALDRRPLAENYFLIAGPPEDPAKVREAADGVDAMRRIAAAKAPFASRADESGTHQRERALFTKAGLDANPSWEGFVRTGSGMGATLQVAGEKRAYVLADSGTFRAFRERTDLVALARPDASLRNVYSVLRVAPAKFPAGRIHAEAATKLADHLLSAQTRALIERFGDDKGEGPLFVPLAGAAAK